MSKEEALIRMESLENAVNLMMKEVLYLKEQVENVRRDS